MAKITLDRSECRDGFLPPRCLRCGADAQTTVLREFTWASPWWYLLLCVGIGILIVIIIRMVLAKKMKVDVPLCPRHKHHWAWGYAYVLLLILLDFAVGIGVATQSQPGQNIPDWMIFGMLGTWVISLILIAVIALTQIRVTYCSDDEITLAGVNAEVALEVQDMQSKSDEEYRAMRKQKKLAQFETEAKEDQY